MKKKNLSDFQKQFQKDWILRCEQSENSLDRILKEQEVTEMLMWSTHELLKCQIKHSNLESISRKETTCWNQRGSVIEWITRRGNVTVSITIMNHVFQKSWKRMIIMKNTQKRLITKCLAQQRNDSHWSFVSWFQNLTDQQTNKRIPIV